MRDGFRFSGALVSFAGLLAGGIASADPAASSAPSTDQTETSAAEPPGGPTGQSNTAQDNPGVAQLEEVVVTATLRRETAQNVPTALTVLGGPQLNALGITNISQMMAAVPGLQLAQQTPGYSIQVLRGITTGFSGIGPTVATYFDDTPTTFVSASSLGVLLTPDPDLFDMQRVEVLKGPQGTLFGASSMGGVIHYVFTEPDLEKFGGKAQVGFEGIPGHGTGDSQHLVVNLPIARDVLGVRIEGFRIESPAYIDNVYREQKDVNTSRSEGGRVAILWRPSEEFRAQLTSYYQRLLTANQPTMDVQPLTLRPTSGDLETAAKLPQSLQSKLFVNNLQLSYDFSAATLLSSTSLEKAHANIALDASNEYGVLFSLGGIPGNAALFREYNDSKKTTEELRLTSRTAGRIEWLVGYYYTDENATNPEFIDQYNAQGATHTPVLPGIVQASIASVLREHALYGDLTYHFGSAFDLQGGVRYDRVTQEYAQPYYIFGGAVGAPEQATATLSKTTYLGTARYHFDRDTMLYARIATGYRPGGPNDKPPTVVTQAVPATYQPDSLISYELGLKGALAARVLGYTVNAYRVEWKNIQALGFDAASGVNFNTNGGKAHSQGLEVSLDYLPLEGLRLGLSGSFGDAKLDEAVPLGSVTAHRGDELPYAPQVAFTGTIDYTHPLTASMNGFAGLTVAHVGSRRIFFAEQAPGIPQLGPEFVSPVGPLPAYTTVDVRAGITRDSVTLTAYARNLSNTRGALGAQNTLVGVDLAQGTVGPLPLSVIPPRTLGVTLQYDF